MRPRGRIDPALARRLMGVITTGTYGDLKVCAWLKLLGAQAQPQTPERAA